MIASTVAHTRLAQTACTSNTDGAWANPNNHTKRNAEPSPTAWPTTTL
jgi:hypothetical protein